MKPITARLREEIAEVSKLAAATFTQTPQQRIGPGKPPMKPVTSSVTAGLYDDPVSNDVKPPEPCWDELSERF